MKTRAFIGVGSNLGEPLENIKLAFARLRQVAEIEDLSSSSLYRTPPIGPEQPDYINGVFQLTCSLNAFELLGILHEIENKVGRNRKDEVRWGPRLLDLDILLFGDQALTSDKLTIPHKELSKRAFVLTPLSELAPDLVISKRLAEDRAQELHDISIRKVHGPIGES